MGRQQQFHPRSIRMWEKYIYKKKKKEKEKVPGKIRTVYASSIVHNFKC